MPEFNPAIYWQNRLESNPGLTGVGFTSLGERFNRWQYKVRARVFRRVVSGLGVDLPSVQVTDIGSGTGFYISRWQELGVRKITGVDITEYSVARLRASFPGADFLQADVGDPGASQALGQPDIVSCFDVLFHIVDDRRFATAIGNIYSALAPGGWFVFSDVFRHGETQQACAHMVSRSLESVEGVLRGAGFEIVQRVPLFVAMNLPLDTRSRMLRLLWRSMTYLAGRSEFYGFLLGAILYPVDRLLTRVLRESPTTEVMLCRKPR